VAKIPSLQELQDKAGRDLIIDEQKLDKCASVTPMLYHVWLNIYSDAKMIYEKTELEYNKLYSDKYYYYRNDYHIIPKNASEINILVDGDEDILAKKKTLVYYTEVLNYVEKVMKQLEQRSFHLRLMMDWTKFQAGGF